MKLLGQSVAVFYISKRTAKLYPEKGYTGIDSRQRRVNSDGILFQRGVQSRGLEHV